jgi:hypothetical protein
MRGISRRSALGTMVAVAATAACGDITPPPEVVACAIWSSSTGDCQTPARFKYVDPSINANHVHGPRHFCSEHTGCATSALVSV